MCTHPARQGDNYGETCLVCGATTAGYGYWGEGSKHCLHDWQSMGADSDCEFCQYCQRERPKAKPTDSATQTTPFPMKAILIDVTTQTVTDVEIEEGVSALYKAIGCQCVDRVVLDDGTDLWIDDEGLLHQPQPPKFRIGGYDHTFAGNGLICGYTAEGHTVSTVYTADQVRPLIEFLGDVHVEPKSPTIISWSE